MNTVTQKIFEVDELIMYKTIGGEFRFYKIRNLSKRLDGELRLTIQETKSKSSKNSKRKVLAFDTTLFNRHGDRRIFKSFFQVGDRVILTLGINRTNKVTGIITEIYTERGGTANEFVSNIVVDGFGVGMVTLPLEEANNRLVLENQ